MGHLLQPARPDAVGASLVFLHLLEGEAECGTQLFLAHRKHLAAHTHPAADVLVDGVRGLRNGIAGRHADRSLTLLSKNRLDDWSIVGCIRLSCLHFWTKVCLPEFFSDSSWRNYFWTTSSRRPSYLVARCTMMIERTSPRLWADLGTPRVASPFGVWIADTLSEAIFRQVRYPLVIPSLSRHYSMAQ